MKKQLVKTSLSIAIGIAIIPLSVFAGQGRFMHFFDTDGDGVVTQTEFEAATAKRFGRMDLNNDGSVSPDEFRDYMKQRRSEFHDRRFSDADSDKNATVSKSEYLEYQRQRAEKQFARLDKDRNGILSKEEFSKDRRGKHGRFKMKKHGNFLFNKLDLDKNGQVTREESLKAWTDWFNRIDANKDLVVTPDEVTDYRNNKWNRK